MWKHLFLAAAAMTPALFGDDIMITFSPATVIYPPGLDTYTCQSNGGGSSPCIAFSGSITDTDTDDSLIALADIAISFNGTGSTYLTGDNTFYNDSAGLLAGDPNSATDSNPFSTTYTGPIFGLDISPNTPWGDYTGSIQISGYNLNNDPGETDEMIFGQQTFTLNVVPEPFTFGLTAACLLLFGASAAAAQTLPAGLTDPVTELSRKIERGERQLAFDPVTGYLPAVLKALDIPVESQMAVFSKTSVQAMRIDPANPRVLFFSDAVIVGWVRGGFVELASHDPRLGMVFYRLDQRPSAYRARMAAATPESPFSRREDCLHCHMTPATLGVPGVLIRSVFPSASGVPLPHTAQYDTDNRVPFAKLWGGWYVTGDSGPAPHMGNRIADEAHPEAMLQGPTVPLDSLDGKCRPDTRLTRFSDIAALMVFEHQARMMNLLTRAKREGRSLELDELADSMLFVDEAPIAGKITGTSGFAEKFSALGPRDRKGRSLRELSLQGRLMRYSCSYMIYSEAFDALPAEAKSAVYRRMWQVLAHRDEADRTAIVEILGDTKKDFPLSAPSL